MKLTNIASKIQSAIKNNSGIEIPVSVLSKGTRFSPNKIPHILLSVPSFEEQILSGGQVSRRYILSVRVASEGEDGAFELAESVSDAITATMPMCVAQMSSWKLLSAESESFMEADAKISVFHMVFSGEYFRGFESPIG